MMDLIGFWSGVTLITWVLLCAPMWCLFIISGVVVDWASRDRVRIGHALNQLFDKVYPVGSGAQCFIWCVSIACWLFYLITLGVSATEGVDIKPVYIIVSEFAKAMTPVMSFVGVFAVVFGGGALLMRKVFDVFFSVQDKLEKLK